ncbi:MAG TPA: hypothetical protein VGL61_25765 [Kofleriaceae bacterium]
MGRERQDLAVGVVLLARRNKPRAEIVTASVSALASVDAQAEQLKVRLQRLTGIARVDSREVERRHHEIVGRWRAAVHLGPDVIDPGVEHARELGVHRNRPRHLRLGALLDVRSRHREAP